MGMNLSLEPTSSDHWSKINFQAFPLHFSAPNVPLKCYGAFLWSIHVPFFSSMLDLLAYYWIIFQVCGWIVISKENCNLLKPTDWRADIHLLINWISHNARTDLFPLALLDQIDHK